MSKNSASKGPKKSRRERSREAAADGAVQPEGMSRKQAKLAARAAERAVAVGSPRPFGGLAAEADIVALREFVPSAEMTVTVTDGTAGGREVSLVTLLPGAVAALVRETAQGGAALVALQTRDRSANPQHDLARALAWAVSAAPGTVLDSAVSGPTAAAEAPELTDLLDPEVAPEVRVHQDFAWWLPEGAYTEPAIEEMISQANSTIMPSYRVAAEVPGAVWWVDAGTRAHFRWIRTEAAGELLDALARVHAADGLHLDDGTRFAGVFRVHGVLVPVWDLDRTRAHDTYAEALADLDRRLVAAATVEAPLTTVERRSRETIQSRQVTLR